MTVTELALDPNMSVSSSWLTSYEIAPELMVAEEVGMETPAVQDCCWVDGGMVLEGGEAVSRDSWGRGGNKGQEFTATSR